MVENVLWCGDIFVDEFRHEVVALVGAEVSHAGEDEQIQYLNIVILRVLGPWKVDGRKDMPSQEL